VETGPVYKHDLNREADRKQCLNDLLCFYGLPPFDDLSNVNVESPVLRERLEKKWGDRIERLEQKTGCDRIRERWKELRDSFVKDIARQIQ
jgi:hypothetical protein